MQTETNLGERVAAELRAERARLGITASDLAQLLHMNAENVRRKLRGDSEITLDEVQLFSSALNINPATIVARASGAKTEQQVAA